MPKCLYFTGWSGQQHAKRPCLVLGDLLQEGWQATIVSCKGKWRTARNSKPKNSCLSNTYYQEPVLWWALDITATTVVSPWFSEIQALCALWALLVHSNLRYYCTVYMTLQLYAAGVRRQSLYNLWSVTSQHILDNLCSYKCCFTILTFSRV